MGPSNATSSDKPDWYDQYRVIAARNSLYIRYSKCEHATINVKLDEEKSLTRDTQPKISDPTHSKIKTFCKGLLSHLHLHDTSENELKTKEAERDYAAKLPNPLRYKAYRTWFNANAVQTIAFTSLHQANLGENENKIILAHLPHDVLPIILNNLSLKEKVNFREVCKAAHFYITHKTNFWFELERNVIKTNIPNILVSTLKLDLDHIPIIDSKNKKEREGLSKDIYCSINHLGKIELTIKINERIVTISEHYEGGSLSSRQHKRMIWVAEHKLPPIVIKGGAKDEETDIAGDFLKNLNIELDS